MDRLWKRGRGTATEAKGVGKTGGAGVLRADQISEDGKGGMEQAV